MNPIVVFKLEKGSNSRYDPQETVYQGRELSRNREQSTDREDD